MYNAAADDRADTNPDAGPNHDPGPAPSHRASAVMVMDQPRTDSPSPHFDGKSIAFKIVTAKASSQGTQGPTAFRFLCEGSA